MESEEEKRNLVLLAAYKLHRRSRSISTYELAEVSGVGKDDALQIIHNLTRDGKGWLRTRTSFVVSLTEEGLKKAKRMTKQRFEEKERLVLQMLYDERKNHPHGLIPDELAAALNMDLSEVRQIVIELEIKGWADGGDETTWIVPAGIKEIEKISQPQMPHIIINNPTNSPMSFGAHSSQTVTYHNQNVRDILPQLSQLIHHLYSLQFETRADAIAELQKVEVLAKGEINEGKWQLIQSRLETTKTALEVGKIAFDTLPYWPAIWHFFFK